MSTPSIAPARLSRRALRTLAAFGLTVDDVHLSVAARERSTARADALAAKVLDALPDRSLALISGPSGAGKSTVLRRLGHLARTRGMTPIPLADVRALALSNRRAVDLVAATHAASAPARHRDRDAVRLLAFAGLADARLVVTRACELSDGERARLAIACAIAEARASPSPLLLLDEFAASLDAVTAHSLARGLSRWLAGSHARAVIATHHTDLHDALVPRVVVRLASGWLTAPSVGGGPKAAQRLGRTAANGGTPRLSKCDGEKTAHGRAAMSTDLPAALHVPRPLSPSTASRSSA